MSDSVRSEYVDKVRSFLSKYFDAGATDPDHDYFAAGQVNSLFAMQLVMFVESEFGITVENEDLDLSNFNTLNAIASFVTRKRGASSSAA